MVRTFQDAAATHLKMVLVIKRSWPSTERLLGSVLLACEKFGIYEPRKKVRERRERGEATKKGNTKLTNCPFSLMGREFERGKWHMYVLSGTHNHDLPDILLGHAYRGRIHPQALEVVKMLSSHGTPPKPIYSLLHSEEGCVTSRRQLYNAKSKLKSKARGDRTITQDVLH